MVTAQFTRQEITLSPSDPHDVLGIGAGAAWPKSEREELGRLLPFQRDLLA
jgi:hypothetical protein